MTKNYEMSYSIRTSTCLVLNPLKPTKPEQNFDKVACQIEDKIKAKYLMKTNINMSVCLPACLPACLCLPACVPACLSVLLYVFMNVCMYATFSGIYVNTKIYRKFF